MADFNPALPVPGKWNVYQNDENDRYNPNGKALRLQIPWTLWRHTAST